MFYKCENNSVDEELASEASEKAPDNLNDELSRISAAIAYNDLIDDRLTRLELLLKKRLRECRERMQDISISVRSSGDVRRRCKHTQYGMPYFKDSNGWRAPYNNEANAMKYEDMIQFYQTSSSPWTVREKRDFIHVMHDVSINMRSNALKQLIKENIAKGLSTKHLKTESLTIHMKSLAELSLPIDEDYEWQDIADLFHRHSAEECTALWKLELHPSINNTVWSSSEINKLNDLVLHYNNENWEAIASELNTGRTAYQCFVKYNSNVDTMRRCKLWTQEDDIFLTRLVKLFKVDNYIPWSKIANVMNNRTEAEVYSRWQLHHNMTGRFLPEEDEVLRLCVNKFGENFSLIAKYLKRSPSQLARRYRSLLNEQPSKWTIDEDDMLLKLINNKSEPDYGKIAKVFKGKTKTQVRLRHLRLERWFSKHRHTTPGNGLVTVPRRKRKHTVNIQSNTSHSLAAALEKLHEKLKAKVKETTQSGLSINDKEIMKFLHEEEFKNNIDKISSEMTGQEINLQVFQFLLRAVLDKEIVESKPYYEEYKSVLENVKVNRKVRSYSKKSTNAANAIVELKMPDLWSSKFGDPHKFIFPPNINTLIACKKLLSNYYKCKSKSVRKMSTKHMFFNEQLLTLLSRFKVLFLWPFRLSITSEFIRKFT